MRKYALPQLESFDQIEQYLQRYPLPAMPELALLAGIAEYVSIITPDIIDDVKRTVAQAFLDRLHRFDLAGLTKEAEDEVVLYVFDIALRDLTYMSAGLLEQTKGQYTQLREAVELLAKNGGQPTDQQLDQAFVRLNAFFDRLELAGDISIPHVEREEFFSSLAQEAEEMSSEVLEVANEELYDILHAADQDAKETLEEELNEIADTVAEDVMLELDPTGYMEGGKQPFYNWEGLVRWFDKTVGIESLEDPESRTRAHIPKVVDVTHLQEETQNAIQRR